MNHRESLLRYVVQNYTALLGLKKKSSNQKHSKI